MRQSDVFTKYLLELGDEVYKYLLCKGATKEDAEDIIQNTFYKILSILSELDYSNLRAWFYRVALNNHIDLIRQRQRFNRFISNHHFTSITDYSDNLQSILNKDEIIMLLKNVKADYREIFILKYYYEFTYEEISKLLSISEETVRKRLYRARKVIHYESRGLKKWINQLKKQ